MDNKHIMYATDVTIMMQNYQFIMDHKCIVPAPSSENSTVEDETVVILSPQHYKKLVQVMGEVLKNYESTFGEITNIEPYSNNE